MVGRRAHSLPAHPLTIAAVSPELRMYQVVTVISGPPRHASWKTEYGIAHSEILSSSYSGREHYPTSISHALRPLSSSINVLTWLIASSTILLEGLVWTQRAERPVTSDPVSSPDGMELLRPLLCSCVLLRKRRSNQERSPPRRTDRSLPILRQPMSC